MKEWIVNVQRKLSGVTWTFPSLDLAMQYVREQAEHEHKEVGSLDDFHVKLTYGDVEVGRF